MSTTECCSQAFRKWLATWNLRPHGRNYKHSCSSYRLVFSIALTSPFPLLPIIMNPAHLCATVSFIKEVKMPGRTFKHSTQLPRFNYLILSSHFSQTEGNWALDKPLDFKCYLKDNVFLTIKNSINLCHSYESIIIQCTSLS